MVHYLELTKFRRTQPLVPPGKVASRTEVRYWIDCRATAERDEIWRRNNAIRAAQAEALAKGLTEGQAQGRLEGEPGLDAETIFKATGIRLSGVPEGSRDV